MDSAAAGGSGRIFAGFHATEGRPATLAATETRLKPNSAFGDAQPKRAAITLAPSKI